MPIARRIADHMTQSSWIRRMFEEGVRLKQAVGADNVFDFSLGNPILEPPEAFQKLLRAAVLQAPPGTHRYMPNAGFPEVRAAVAEYLRRALRAPVEAEDVIMTCGAGGALNVALKALLDPQDEVVLVAPYFPEYRFYVDNHEGRPVIAESAGDFDLDIEALDAAVGPRTKAIILNSPNNPTGRMYTEERLAELGLLLAVKERSAGRPITILSDEPYRKIVYDGRQAPSIFAAHPHSIFITSHSKDLGLAGERIGYAAICPHHADREELREAFTFANRTLGFVNAPAIFQRTVARAQELSVPVEVYERNRELLCEGLARAGMTFFRPDGAFYLFPRTPTADDLAFVRALQRQRILAVPGSGFGRGGHIRLSFCVTEREIRGALPGFRRAIEELR